jgi:predicted deacylase
MKQSGELPERGECPWRDVPPASKTRTWVPLVMLPGGAPVSLPLLVARGARQGKTLLISGGVHGDEFEALAAIWRVFKQLEVGRMAGTFAAVPVVNVPAYERGGRTSEDHQDLARTFPGDASGTVTEQIAHHFAACFVAHADLYCDLHSAGQYYEIEPLTGYMLVDGPALELQRCAARAFGFDVVWGTSPLPGRSLSAAHDYGVPAIYAEARGAGGCLNEDIDRYVFGVRQLLRLVQILPDPPEPFEPKLFVEDAREGSGYLQIQNRAPAGGVFATRVALGQHVDDGQGIGDILDPTGRAVCTVRSTTAGRVIFLRTFPRVRPGDPLVTVMNTPPA